MAIALHWIIAAIIVLQILLGWRMSDSSGAARTALLQLHKSIGLCILILSVARLAWRLANPPPSPPDTVSRLERAASHGVHVGFYGIMIGLPLTGWIMASATRPGVGLTLFGLIPWFKLPVNLLPPTLRFGVSEFSGNTHVALVWVTLGLLAMHVAGALKHQLFSRDMVMQRMTPGMKTGGFDPRLIVIAVVGLVAAALAYAPRPSAPIRPRPAPTSLASADVYLDLVQPALTRRCASCHNDERAKGGLSLVSYDALMFGGKDGAVVAPGRPDHSELYRRLTLPSAHQQRMPANGRAPLTVAQVEAIRWWIATGAPAYGELRRYPVAEVTRPALAAVLNLAGTDGIAGENSRAHEALPIVGKGDAESIKALATANFVVRPVSVASNLLDIDYYGRQDVTDADIANLVKLAPQVRTLKLASSGISDSQLRAIGQMEHLVLLRLEHNPITDSGLASLAGMKSLRSINIYGTAVSDAGLNSLLRLPRLQRIYAWGTKITPAAVARAKSSINPVAVELDSPSMHSLPRA